MTCDVTAVVLSPNPFLTVNTWGMPTVLYTNKFEPGFMVDDLHHYRKKSVFLPEIKTKYMTWVDDDDELPPDVLDVCRELVEKIEQEGTLIGYTNETLRYNGKDITHPAKQYSREAYIQSGHQVMHHLIVMNVDAAREVSALLPEGPYWVEFMFNIYLAELGIGATYLNRTGYIWNRVDASANIHNDSAYKTAFDKSKAWVRTNLPSRY